MPPIVQTSPAVPHAKDNRCHDLLIVDPDERFAATLQGYFEEQGWQVARAVDPRGALQRWNDLAPRVLITELEGTDLDGFGLLGAVAAMDQRPSVIVCSRHAAAATMPAEALEALGVDAVLSRPFRLETLAGLVASVVQQRETAVLLANECGPPVSGDHPITLEEEGSQCQAS